jgi:hypothetical protein
MCLNKGHADIVACKGVFIYFLRYSATGCTNQELRFFYAVLKHTNWNMQYLPVVIYGCETWSLTLREEHRRSVIENRVLRIIFGPKIDEVRGGS